MAGDFERVFNAWRELPFPQGSSNDEIDELHADLVLVDAWLAEAIIPFVDDGVYVPIKVDPFAAIHEIKARASRLATSASTRDKQLLDQYARYADALHDAYEGFVSAAPPH